MYDDIFDALADRQRRRLLVELLDRGVLSVSELSGHTEAVAAANAALLRERLERSRELGELEENLLRMHVIHLPMLVEHGFVEWDREAQLVTEGPRYASIRPVLELIASGKLGRRPAEPVVGVDE